MVNPYLNWFATDQLSIWGTFGYGRGEVRQEPEEGASNSRKDSLTSGAGGIRFQVLSGVDGLTGEGSPLGLAFKLDAATSSFLDTTVQLVRLAGELSRSFSMDSGLLTGTFDLGWTSRSVARKDNLDALRRSVADRNDDASGVELAASLNWIDSQGSLSATGDARVLLGGGDRSEWGILAVTCALRHPGGVEKVRA